MTGKIKSLNPVFSKKDILIVMVYIFTPILIGFLANLLKLNDYLHVLINIFLNYF
ncbi:hypothetical protein [Acinetobacter baumannii]|uniref:hypothetical protein n=1 Tax=Acinetobacter baumannii TaxID=470 RepID=UPI00148A8903|nr:hypothetical protein [Acinetobacter baumannii]